MWKRPCFTAAAQHPRYSTPSRSSPKPKQHLQTPTGLRGNSLFPDQLERVGLIPHKSIQFIISRAASVELRLGKCSIASAGDLIYFAISPDYSTNANVVELVRGDLRGLC